VIQKPDPRSAVSIGLDWGTRITSIGLEFALPAFLGFGLDRWWKTSPWMTLIGAFLGLATGMTHVIRLGVNLQKETGQSVPGTEKRETSPDSEPRPTPRSD